MALRVSRRVRRCDDRTVAEMDATYVQMDEERVEGRSRGGF